MTASKVDIIKLQFVAPFESNAQTSIYKKRALRCHAKLPGCYMIKENGKVVYIGMSQSCVVEALYRHFYEWNDRRGNNLRVTYFDKMKRKKFEVVIIPASSEDALLLEQSLVLIFNPRDNKDKFENVIPKILEKYGYQKREKKSAEWEAVDVEF